MSQVHRGVKGVVKDSSGKPVEGATVVVQQVWDDQIITMPTIVTSQEGLGSLRKNVTTSSRGEFWRLLVHSEGNPQHYTRFTVAAELNACDKEGTVISSSPFQVDIVCILQIKLRTAGVFSEQGTTFRGNPTGA